MRKHILPRTAAAIAAAVLAVSCGRGLKEADRINLAETPLQTVDSMFMVQTENGRLQMRMEAPVMERYDNDSLSYELFPQGIAVFRYNQEGLLESTLRSDNARHSISKAGPKRESWAAFGSVVIRNVPNQEVMETDTIYWDQALKEIYTDCYVRLSSPKGLMQGYGMRSDELARNAVINRPFNSYGVAVQDSTEVLLDTENLIGPLPRRERLF